MTTDSVKHKAVRAPTNYKHRDVAGSPYGELAQS